MNAHVKIQEAQFAVRRALPHADHAGEERRGLGHSRHGNAVNNAKFTQKPMVTLVRFAIGHRAKDSGVSVKAEFHDLAGTLLKTLENSNVMLLDAKQNKYQPMQVQVKNHQTGHATFLKFEQFVANQPVSEGYFAAGYLEKEE